MALYSLNDRQHATVLAALRFWQRKGAATSMETFAEADIATNGDTLEPLTLAELDLWIESELNTGGLDFGKATLIYAAEQLAKEPHLARYLLAAPYMRYVREGEVELAEPGIVSKATVPEADAGAYVLGWIWVDDDVVIAPEDIAPVDRDG